MWNTLSGVNSVLDRNVEAGRFVHTFDHTTDTAYREKEVVCFGDSKLRKSRYYSMRTNEYMAREQWFQVHQCKTETTCGYVEYLCCYGERPKFDRWRNSRHGL